MDKVKHETILQKMKDISKVEYNEKINKVVRYVNDNITNELSTDELAQVANLSKFHFHRIFQAVYGERLAVFIKRVRLEKAVRLLLFEDISIADIAELSGFSSPELFTRNFNAHYGLTPKQWRSSGEKTLIKSIKTKFEVQNHSEIIEYPVSIKKLPSYKIAYVTYIGQYGTQTGEAYAQVLEWAKHENLFNSNTKFIGITLDNPYVTPINKCRYYAGVTLNAAIKPNNIVGYMEIPSLYCAVCEYSGHVSEISSSYDYLYSKWLPNSGYVPDNYNVFEIRDEWSDKSLHRTLNICLPIKKI